MLDVKGEARVPRSNMGKRSVIHAGVWWRIKDERRRGIKGIIRVRTCCKGYRTWSFASFFVHSNELMMRGRLTGSPGRIVASCLELATNSAYRIAEPWLLAYQTAEVMG